MAETFYKVINGTAATKTGDVVRLDPSQAGCDMRAAILVFVHKVNFGDPAVPVFIAELESPNAGAGVVMDPTVIAAEMRRVMGERAA